MSGLSKLFSIRLLQSSTRFFSSSSSAASAASSKYKYVKFRGPSYEDHSSSASASFNSCSTPTESSNLSENYNKSNNSNTSSKPTIHSQVNSSGSGFVVSKKRDTGFGFISPKKGGPDVFFHRNDCESKEIWEKLREGSRVEYDAQPDPANNGKFMARKIKIDS